MRAAGLHHTPDESQDLEKKRQRVAARIRDFHTSASRLLGSEAVALVIGTPDHLNTDGYVRDEIRRPENRGPLVSMTEIENMLLCFPSVLPGHRNPLITDLRSRECRLRRGKANDTLGSLRETLSGLSYQYINKVRQAATSRDHLRAFDGVKLLSKEVSYYQQVYNRNSRALGELDSDLKRRYPRLRRKDCSISAAVADVNAPGQSQVRLAWFWAATDGWDAEVTASQSKLLDNDRLLECRCSLRYCLYYRC